MDHVQPSAESNFLQPGKETDRQVTFSDEIVVLNQDSSGNNETVNTEQPSTASSSSEARKGNVGRPSTEQSAINAENRMRQEQERKARNPPVRSSSRLANKK